VGGVFWAIEAASTALFTLEYALRLWCCVEHMPQAERSSVRARLSWASSPAALIDLAAIVPFYLALLAGLDLRALALARLLRFFKLARYSPGLTSLVEAVRAERKALVGTLLILGALVLMTASLMHLVEREAQPEAFGTIPHAMWWAVVTLTTVGYGDVVPVTATGRFLAGLTAIMGLALLALPVGIIATSFAEVIHKRQFVVTWSMVARVPIFADLDAASLAEVMQHLSSRTARRNEVIIHRGERAAALYLIVRGDVEVERRDAPAVRLGQGEVFGEIAILQGGSRRSTVRARRDTELLVLLSHDLERLMDRMPELRRRIGEIGHARAPDRIDPQGQPKPGAGPD
jgi:voltage-gated potassium channel